MRGLFRSVLFGIGIAAVLVGGLLSAQDPGPFAPAAGTDGSTAIPSTSERLAGWAFSVVDYSPGEDVDAVFQDPEKALGPTEAPGGDAVESVVSLGRGGSITLGFENPVRDGPGFDLVVFENGFSDFFLELAYFEVSSDGEQFFRYPSTSLTAEPVGAFGEVDPTRVNGLAGKYRQGFGTPFELAELQGAPGLDLRNVRFVRLVDVVGGVDEDSAGNLIYDPFPTIGSAGFDLDGVGYLFPAVPGTEPNLGGWLNDNGLVGADPLLDLDGDGLTLLEEYVSGGRPLVRDPALLQVEAVTGGVALSWRQRPDLFGVEVIPESAPPGGDFSPLEFGSEQLEAQVIDEGTLWEVRLRVSPDQPFLYRLRVEPEPVE